MATKTARYNGSCFVCTATIYKGAKIEDGNPAGAWHVECKPSVRPAQPVSVRPRFSGLQELRGRFLSSRELSNQR